MVESKTADAILDVSITEERKQFISFPEEALSEGITVFFVKKESKISFTNLSDLKDLKAGAILGYSYCEEIDQSAFMKHAARVTTLEQLFKMLLLGRIDFLMEVDAVGYYTAKKMGILNQVTVIPNAMYCRGGNYLGFSKKAGNEKLAIRFSNELQAFQKTQEYKEILNKYGYQR